MPLITAQALPLKTACPSFGNAKDVVSGEPVRLNDLKGRPLLVFFICNHCPKTVPLRPAISVMATEFYSTEQVHFVAVSSNDLLYCPMDGPEDMRKEKQEFEWGFPYLFDEDQSVAKAFGAALTPECFLYDASHELVYHGAFGENCFALKSAIEALLEGQPIAEPSELAQGCDIKWTMPGPPPLRRPEATPNAPPYWSEPPPETKEWEDQFHLQWNEKYASGAWKSFPVEPPPGL